MKPPALFAAMALIAVPLVGGFRAPPARVLTVPGDFPTIQAAHDAARSGDTILVAPGRYTGEITLTKAVVLGSHFMTTGDTSFIDRTILDGGGGDFVVEIPRHAEDGATIQGVTIENAEDGITPRARFNLLNCLVRRNEDGVDYERGAAASYSTARSNATGTTASTSMATSTS